MTNQTSLVPVEHDPTLPQHNPVFNTAPCGILPHSSGPFAFHIPVYIHNAEWMRPDVWPDWFHNVHACLDKLILPECYADLLTVHAYFEGKHGFNRDGASVLSMNRPQEVGLWIKNAHKKLSVVSPTRVDQLKSEFWAQPHRGYTSEQKMIT